MASGARLESSASAGAIRTISGATTRKSCGSSVCFGFSVECIGAPYSVQCRPHKGGFTLGSTNFCPTLQPCMTKARRYDGEYGAAYGDSLWGTRPSRGCKILTPHADVANRAIRTQNNAASLGRADQAAAPRAVWRRARSRESVVARLAHILRVGSEHFAKRGVGAPPKTSLRPREPSPGRQPC